MVKEIFKFLGILWLEILAIFVVIYVGMTYIQPRIVAMPYPYNVLIGMLIIGTLLGGIFYGVMWTLTSSKNTEKKDDNN